MAHSGSDSYKNDKKFLVQFRFPKKQFYKFISNLDWLIVLFQNHGYFTEKTFGIETISKHSIKYKKISA